MRTGKLRLVQGTMLLVALTGLRGAHAAEAPAVRSAGSGVWSAAATWEGGRTPVAGQKVLIRAGHEVTYDVSSDHVIRSLHISGTLAFAPDRNTKLEVGLIKVQPGESTDEEGFSCHATMAPAAAGTAKPALLVGTPDRPIDAGRTAVIRLHAQPGMDPQSLPAIISCGGRMEFHGQPMSHTWVKLGADARGGKDKGDASITLAEPVTGWKPGDRIIVTGTTKNAYRGGSTEERAIKAIEGAKITLDAPLSQSHTGEGEYRAEVANLSRNVIVESADPAGVRGHTMFHRHSAGSISYAKFRHLGKEGVLGKYAIHFHLAGDTMRGTSIVGASIWDSANRFITIHGTQYLVVRDCVGYKSIGHGFFLEDGTEVYNVFDRNLAIEAAEGKPLPDQALPFDKNDGAGFWWANSHNTFTRNVAVGCGQYGFRFDAQPRAGVSDSRRQIQYGDAKKPFDLALPVRQPNGTEKPVDIRTLPFVRFESNESHGNGKWGLNLGQGVAGVGPDRDTPFVIRDMKIWAVFGGWGVEAPNVLIDGMDIHSVSYGVRESMYVAQDYRNVSLQARDLPPVSTVEQYVAQQKAGVGNRRTRMPGWPEGTGDGGPKYQAAEVEVAKLTPIDRLPPITVITHVTRRDGKLLVRGTTSDNGEVTRVLVNGREATGLAANFAEWEAVLDAPASTETKLTAHAIDAAGNVEKTPHERVATAK